MFERNKRPNVLRAAISTPIGILLFIFIFVFVVGIGSRVLISIPVHLGLIRQLQLQDIVKVEIPGTTTIELTETTDHHIYLRRRVQRPHHVTIQSASTGEFINLEEQNDEIYYETNLVEGLLIYKFKVEESGAYELSDNSSNQKESLIIAPSFSKRNTIVLSLFFGVPLLLIGFSVWYFYFRPTPEDEQLAKSRNKKLDRWLELQNGENFSKEDD